MGSKVSPVDAMNGEEIRTIRLFLALYHKCLESERRFREAFEEARDCDLKYLFNSYWLQRARFAAQLREVLASRGGDAEGTGREEERPDRARLRRSSREVLNDCAREEDLLLAHYETAMTAELSGPVRALLESQRREVESVSVRIRELAQLAHPK